MVAGWAGYTGDEFFWVEFVFFDEWKWIVFSMGLREFIGESMDLFGCENGRMHF